MLSFPFPQPLRSSSWTPAHPMVLVHAAIRHDRRRHLVVSWVCAHVFCQTATCSSQFARSPTTATSLVTAWSRLMRRTRTTPCGAIILTGSLIWVVTAPGTPTTSIRLADFLIRRFRPNVRVRVVAL
jgi:hypothetical protein